MPQRSVALTPGPTPRTWFILYLFRRQASTRTTASRHHLSRSCDTLALPLGAAARNLAALLDAPAAGPMPTTPVAPPPATPAATLPPPASDSTSDSASA